MSKKDNPFKVPENYFNELEEEILSKLSCIPKKKYFFANHKSILKYAALVLLFLGVSGIISWNLSKQNEVLKQEYAYLKTNKPNNIQTKIKLTSEENTINSIASSKIKTEANKNKSVSITKPKILEQENSELNLSEEELEYLEYYLQDDIINDYLTYNE